jgi:hypothetical protein
MDMKAKLLLSCILAAGLASSARAQLFGPETARNVLLGGIIGAVIGDNSHHQAAAGAVIGATAGYLWSQATVPAGQPVAVAPARAIVYSQPQVVYEQPQVVYAEAPVVYSEPRAVVLIPACPPPPVFRYRACPVPARVVVVAPAHGSHRRVVANHHSRRSHGDRW